MSDGCFHSETKRPVRRFLQRLYRNWPVHNLIAHPLSEIVHWLAAWCCGHRISGWIHDVTVPLHEKGTGRG